MFLGVLEYECVATEDSGNKDLEFQVGEVLTHTRPIYIYRSHRVLSAPSGGNRGPD